MIDDPENDDFDAFIDAIDAALTELYGPNHQVVMASAGGEHSAFQWGIEDSLASALRSSVTVLHSLPVRS